MKISDKSILFICIFGLFGRMLIAQENQTGTTAASYLEIGIGSRAVGMGGAYVAMAEGPTAAYWNPAGLGMMDHTEVSVMHMNWVTDIDMQSVSFGLPIPQWFTIGIMINSLSIPDDKVRTVDDPEGLSGETFDANNISLSFLLARQFTDRFSVGLGFKYINESILNESGNALAIDMGVLIKTHFLNDMILGMSISNFGTDLKFGGEDLRRSIAARPDIWGANQNIPAEFQTGSYPLPLIFRVGIAMDIWRTNIQKLTLAIDGLHPNNTSEYVNIGGEYIFSAFRKTSEFAIRGGYNSLFMKDSQQGLTLGGGMSFYISENFSLEIDYAFADYEYFGSVHRYSVGLKF